MSAADQMSSCAAAADSDNAEPLTAVETSVAPALRDMPVADPSAPALKRRGRPAKKPKIDIDNEIQEASRLAELFRKMQAASKVAARNATRSKQRLIRKANRFSEQDLMRLAVLKRCGLFAPEEEGDVAVASPFDEAVPSLAKKTKAQQHISCRFKSLVSSVPGAAEVLEGLDKGALSAIAASSAVCSSASASSAVFPLKVADLKRLPPKRSKKVAARKVAKSQSVALESGDDTDRDVGMGGAVEDEKECTE